MKRFVLSPAATADVEQIEAFLDEHAPHATDSVLSKIRATLRRIASMWLRAVAGAMFSARASVL